jgi:hypothetical protein
MKEEFLIFTDNNLYSLAGRISSSLEMLKKSYHNTAVTTMAKTDIGGTTYIGIVFYSGVRWVR